MSIIKEKIKYLGTDMNLKFVLDSEENLLGYQQEIDNLTQGISNDLINPEIDVEERNIKYYSEIGKTYLQFQYYNQITGLFDNSYITAGFSGDNISGSSLNVLNSFYILDFYDNFDPNTQIKISTSYLTKIIGYDSGGTRNFTPTYVIGATISNQLYDWYLPVWYLNNFTGTTATGYTKISFYNAKTGKIVLFYNYDNENLTTPEKMYFRININLIDKTWKFITTSLPYVIARELTTSIQYTDRVNKTVVNYDNNMQSYPSGNTFVYLDGKYV